MNIDTMNINIQNNIFKLYKGLTLKNNKELCTLLEVKPMTSTNSKKAFYKELERYCTYTKQGQKIIITEIFPKPLDKIDHRGTANNRKEFPNFLISKEDENKVGIYTIVLNENNDIYIGSTTTSFRQRYIQHRKFNSRSPMTYKMLKDGAIFDLLEICKNMSEPQIRELENQYIAEYRNYPNWNVVNTNSAWSYSPSNKPKKPKSKRRIPKEKIFKQKYRNIKFKVKAEDYNKTMTFLKENNLINEGVK